MTDSGPGSELTSFYFLPTLPIPRSVESSEPIYYSSSESGSEDGGGEGNGESTPTRLQLRAELSATRRREPCRARRQLDFSQDDNDRIVPSFWDRED